VKARREEQLRNTLEDKYSSLFAQRTSHLEHIGWATSRGETAEANKVKEGLADVDKKIDECEKELEKVYNMHGVANAAFKEALRSKRD
jgi:hypothetical protein